MFIVAPGKEVGKVLEHSGNPDSPKYIIWKAGCFTGKKKAWKLQKNKKIG